MTEIRVSNSESDLYTKKWYCYYLKAQTCCSLLSITDHRRLLETIRLLENE
jgi:hypothetical protein